MTCKFTLLLSDHLKNYLRRLDSCAASLRHWFWENDLHLSPDKLKVCFFGAGQKLSGTLLPPYVTVANCPIMVSNKLKILGVTLDAAVIFKDYVNHVTKACKAWGLHHICRSISRDVANTMAACIVGIRLDYYNALLHGITEK